MISFLKLIGLVIISLHVNLVGIAKFTINVTDGNNVPIPGVKVTLVPEVGGNKESLPEIRSGLFQQAELDGGIYQVVVSCKGYEKQSRSVLVNESNHKERFYLGKFASDYTYSGGALLPFKADPYTLAITYRQEFKESLMASVAELDLEWSISSSSGYALLRNNSPLPATNNNKLATLRNLEGVVSAGPIFSNELRMALFGQHILVTFKPSTSRLERAELLNTHGLKEVRKLFGQSYLLEIPADLGLGVNQLLDVLQHNSHIATVDPNLIALK